MKTKTIEGFVHEGDVGDNGYLFKQEADRLLGLEYRKATLVIELPEPKIEITPNRLKEAYFSTVCRDDGFLGMLKFLFGSDYEG